MLKWFRAKGQHHAETVTDDPLATIRHLQPHPHRRDARRPLEIYAVSRINPLFYDGVSPPPPDDAHEARTKDAAKEGSSGYDSNIYNSSSECSSGADSGDVQQQQTVLRRDAVTVLEQDAGFVQSILVAVPGGGTKKKHSRKPSGSSSSAPLSPIPEGAVDYCIPRPVWPPSDARHDAFAHAQDPIVDDALLLYTRLTCAPALPIPRVGARHTPNDASKVTATTHARDPQLVLRQLSDTIGRALRASEPVSHDALLRSLSETIMRGLDAGVANCASSASSEEALKRLSYTLSQSDRLTRMTRALSNSSGGSSGGSSVRGVSRPLLATSATSPAASDGVVASSSSSAASSSGFSDCTRTPSSTASSSESPSSRRGKDIEGATVFGGQEIANPPVFVHADLAGVSTGARNALLYGSAQCRTSASAVTVSYDKLLSAKEEGGTPGGSADARKATTTTATDEDGLWETFCGTGVTEGDVRLKSDGCYHHHWSPDRPDFTLDMPRAERLMRQIKAAKKRRCWCHFITSLVGLIFFLVSVMVVSLMLTRGKRIFGSL